MTPTNPIPEGMKAAVSEMLSHRGERPYRVLRGGQELWETWVPAFTAALRYLPKPTPHVGDSAAERARECLANIMKRDGLGHQAEEVRSGSWDHTGYIEAMLAFASQEAAQVGEHLAVAKGGGDSPLAARIVALRNHAHDVLEQHPRSIVAVTLANAVLSVFPPSAVAALAKRPAMPTRRGRLTMPADTSAPAEVVQADRDAAAELLGYYDEPTSLLYAIKLGLRDGHPVVQAFGTHRPAQALEGGCFWLIVREPGMVPDRKGPWPLSETAKILREFMAANPTAFIDYLTITPEGEPDIEHGPLVLQYTDGRSMSVGRKHNARTKEAAQAALAERPAMPMPERDLFGEAANLVYRIEAAGHLSHEAQNFERWKADARALAPRLRHAVALLSQDRGEGVEDVVMLPREPTEAMMNAGLYHSSHDSTWADVHTIWKAMFDAVALDGGTSTQLPADPATLPSPASGEGELLAWLTSQTLLSLDHYSPVYGDDDDQSVEWRVTRESGSINDREFDVIGRGETVVAALQEARAALDSQQGETA